MMRFLLALAALTFAAGVQAQAPLHDTLIPYLQRYRLPALAAAVVARGKTVAAGAVGTRQAGRVIPVTLDDRFHLGECTQPMTARLAAILVEQKRLLWSSTVADVFGELADDMAAPLKRVTLEQLLAHRSGLPVDNEILANLVQRARLEPASLAAQRYRLLRDWSRLPLAALPGERELPATMNYVMAGAMIERAAGRSWEELVTERIFIPLELHTAGLGPQSSLGRVDAALGHRLAQSGFEPVLAGPDAGRPGLLGPAGDAHMSVLDFARWAAFSGANSAVGWAERTPEWTARPLLHCRGSNGANTAHAWLDRDGRAVVLLTNIAGAQAESALGALARQLYPKN
jgi:CubicO group peptidase (beta-lactamase class C family)